MVQNLFLQILSGILGIWLATRFITGIEFTGDIKALILAGLVLGIINCFIKPILKIIIIPLKLLTLGLSSLIINLGVVWLVVDLLFTEAFEIHGIIPLVGATLIIWGLSLLFSLFGRKRI